MAAPRVARAGEQTIDQRNGQGEERERPEQPVRPEELELDDPCAGGHERGEQHAPGARVRRRPRIRDHEEREEHERAAFESVDGDGERLSEPEGPADEQRRIGAEKGHRHVAPGRAVHDEPSRRSEEEPEHGRAAPLTGRDPHLARQEHHRHQREVGRVEDVLAVDSQDELARDGDGRRDDHQAERIRPEQETERKPGDQRALRVERGESVKPRCRGLHQQDRGECGDGVGARHVEPEPAESVEDEAREHGDLVQTRIPSTVVSHPVLPSIGCRGRHGRHAP